MLPLGEATKRQVASVLYTDLENAAEALIQKESKLDSFEVVQIEKPYENFEFIVKVYHESETKITDEDKESHELFLEKELHIGGHLWVDVTVKYFSLEVKDNNKKLSK